MWRRRFHREARRGQTPCECARDRQRGDVHIEHRLPVARGPKDLPPRRTVHDYFVLWSCDRILDRIHHALSVNRERAEFREASPTAAIIDSQSITSAEKGGHASIHTGFDAGKLIKGKKRHILVDTLGILLHAIVHSAVIQDRDGGILLMATLFGQFPFLEKLFCRQRLSRPDFCERARRNADPLSKPKSSDDPITPKDSSNCPSVGSSNARSPGSTVAVVSPEIGKISTATPSRS